MKKLSLILLLLFISFQAFSQSLTTPSPASSGSTITISGSGETSSGYFSSISFDPTLTTSSSPSSGAYVWITATFKQITNFYNIASQQPTTFTMDIANGFNAPITVSLGFRCVVYNFSGGGSTNVTKYVTLTVNPVPVQTVFKNVAKSGTFTKNNCPTGATPSTHVYTVAANTYTSTVSQADADNKAIADINANGQNYANNNGKCTFSNVAQSGVFTQTYCAQGTPDNIPFTIPAGAYTSIISQADADQQAANALTIQGQNNVDANGTCGGTKPVFTLTNSSSKRIDINVSTTDYSYLKYEMRNYQTGQVTSGYFTPGGGSIPVPTTGDYGIKITLYSSSFPAPRESGFKDIHVSF
jgi:hypothetical protein